MYRESFVCDLPQHLLVFQKRNQRLVVTFDFAFAEKEPQPRRPWGENFIAEQGLSHLGIMVKYTDWYRDAALHRKLVELRDAGFFAAFNDVTFAGGSMGGFGAGAFSSLSPGSKVFALNPQSTCNPSVVPWETRFERAKQQDWSTLFSDVAIEIADAGQVFVAYDPYCELDKRHAMRFAHRNCIQLHCPFYEHHIPVHLQRLGILKATFAAVLDGTLTSHSFAELMRKRRQDTEHWKKLFLHARKKNRLARMRTIAQHCMRHKGCDSKTLGFFQQHLVPRGPHSEAIPAVPA